MAHNILTPIPQQRRRKLRPLFNGFTGLHGVIDSVLEGCLGEAFADDPVRPRVAHLVLDFNAVAGDPDTPRARAVLVSLAPGEHLAVPESWEDRLLEVRGERLHPYDRFAYAAPGEWNREKLAALRGSLPKGFVLERVTGETVREFEALADSLIYNFDSPQDFLARGVGFGVRHTEAEDPRRFIAGCSSFAISSGSLEFEIQTHPDYQRRGLALVTGSRMIEHCIESGLEACWDAAHEGSARLAERLGFVDGRRYTAYRLA